MQSARVMLRSLCRRCVASARGAFGHNVLWTLLAQTTRLGIQAVYFVMTARALGPVEYGGFVAVTAATAVLSPFVGLGSGSLLVKNVAPDRRLFPVYWGKGILLVFVSGTLLALTMTAGSRLIFSSAILTGVIVLVSFSDFVFLRLLELAACGFQALDRLRKTAILNTLPSLGRLVGIVGLVAVVREPTVSGWAAAYFAATLVAAIIGVIWLSVAHGLPVIGFGRLGLELREGAYFSVSASTFNIYSDIDKTLLANLGSLGASGVYAAAYRLIDLGFLPVRSVLTAAYANMFRYGAGGIGRAMSYSLRLGRKVIWCPLVAAGAILAGAPLVPYLLGSEYGQATEALRWLSAIPLLKTVQYFAADALTGAGFQGLRTLAQVVVAAVNVGLNVWLIPLHSWRGAAWASLGSNGLLGLLLWVAALTLSGGRGPKPRRVENGRSPGP